MWKKFILTAVLVLLLSGSSYAWLDGWKYRRSIIITEQSGNALTDYQVLLNIDTASLIAAGKMKPDCSDLRFTDNADNLLSYWIEDGCNSANTKIWIKVPNIPASSSVTIYMYYGNQTATSESNGYSVFDLFDDFEDGTLSWTMVTGTWVESGGLLNRTIVGSGNGDRIKKAFTDSGLNYRIRFKAWVDTSNAGYKAVGVSIKSSNTDIDSYDNGYMIWFYGNGISYGNKIRIFRANAGTVTELTVTYANLGSGVWHEYEVRYLDGKITACSIDLGICTSATDTTYTTGKVIRLWADGGGSGDNFIDSFAYILLTKYTDPEPTYEVKEEETGYSLDFLWNPIYPYTNEIVTFNATYKGNFTKFWWFANDSLIGTGQQLNYSFDVADLYNITLVGYEGEEGKNHTTSKLIRVYEPLSAGIIISDYLLFVGFNESTSITLTANGGTGNYNYSIYVNDSLISSDNGTEFTPIETGYYNTYGIVCDTLHNSCVNTNTITFFAYDVEAVKRVTTQMKTNTIASVLHGEIFHIKTIPNGFEINLTYGNLSYYGSDLTLTGDKSLADEAYGNNYFVSVLIQTEWDGHHDEQNATVLVADWSLDTSCTTPNQYCVFEADLYDEETGESLNTTNATIDFLMYAYPKYSNINYAKEFGFNFETAPATVYLCVNGTLNDEGMYLSLMSSYSAPDYVARTYSFDYKFMQISDICSFNYSNKYKFFLISATDPYVTDTEIKVTENGQPVEGVYVNVLRQFNGIWETVASGKTNIEGKIIEALKWYYTPYKFVIYKDGEMLYESSPSFISQSPYTIEIASVPAYYKNENVSVVCEYLDTEKTFRCLINNNEGKTFDAHLWIRKFGTNALVCEREGSSTSVSLICNMTGYSGDYTYKLKITTNGVSRYYTGAFTTTHGLTIGVTGILLTMFIISVLALAFAYSPIASIIVSLIAIIVGKALGFFLISMTGLGALIAIALISVYSIIKGGKAV